MPHDRALQILTALHQGLDQLPEAARAVELVDRFRRLPAADRDALIAFESEVAGDVVPRDPPPAAEPAAPAESALRLFPGLPNTPAWAAAAGQLPDFDPCDPKYENGADALNWLTNRGGVRIQQLTGSGEYRRAVRSLQRSHERRDAAWSSASNFRYPVADPTPAQPVRLAIFGDQGMEVGPVRWIAPAMAAWLGQGPRTHSVALHLGDIYYSGAQHEVERYFGDMAQVAAKAELWSICGDHERFSDGGAPFWTCLDKARRDGWTRQQGGYFALENERFQIVAIDAFADRYARLPPDETVPDGHGGKRPLHSQRGWLGDAMHRVGNGRLNLLATQAPALGRGGHLTTVHDEVTQHLGADASRIHGWFWGDDHHAGVYQSTQHRPYVGFLTGHAGRPAKASETPSPTANAIHWESEPRYPQAWIDNAVPHLDAKAQRRLHRQAENIRNGWVQVALHHDGTARVAYVDWMGNPRFSGSLARVASGGHLVPDAAPTLLP